ncbi:MAG: aminopeptidase P N-terminal domain-containing protein [Solirubrobacteraceae bacterium]
MDAAALEEPIARELARRRGAAAAEWGLVDEIVLIGAGDLISVPGRGDRTYPFHAHSEYFYLTDRNRPGGVLAFDPQEGWFDFVLEVTEEERLWSGAAGGEVDGIPLGQLSVWLGARRERSLACLGVPPPPAALEMSCDPALGEDLRLALNGVRRPKDEVELARMRAAERATSAAFAAVVPLLVDGTTERAAQIELEAAALRHGADAMAYDTVIGAGANAAVLHFLPTGRRMHTGDLVLIDAGAEYRGYASDITRTYAVGGRLDPEQQELHSVVHAAERAAIDCCAPGTEWVDVHLTAARVIAEGLVAFGLLRGEPTALVESGAVWLFFPHGVGHLVGLGVRDAAGPLRERRGTPPQIPNLRIDLPLRPGFVVTVEPGIYFVPAILQDAGRRRRHRDAVNWDRVDRMLDFGGIRIEDNVLIIEAGHEILTADVPLLG